jgi:hypothetical protein
MSASRVVRAIAAVIVVVGAYAAILPYAGPAFGYPMPPGSDQPAWEWTASHTQLHLLPGIAATVAGGLMLLGRRMTLLAGSALAALAGTWLIVGPFVSDAWLGGGMGGMAGEASLTMRIITPLGYHYVPGVVALGSGAFALGSILAARPSADTGERRPGRPSARRAGRSEPQRELAGRR